MGKISRRLQFAAQIENRHRHKTDYCEDEKEGEKFSSGFLVDATIGGITKNPETQERKSSRSILDQRKCAD